MKKDFSYIKTHRMMTLTKLNQYQFSVPRIHKYSQKKLKKKKKIHQNQKSSLSSNRQKVQF